MQQSKVFVGMVLILIFAEVLGLYGYGHRYNSDVESRQRFCRSITDWRQTDRGAHHEYSYGLDLS